MGHWLNGLYGEYYGNDLFCLRSRISEVDTLYSRQSGLFNLYEGIFPSLYNHHIVFYDFSCFICNNLQVGLDLHLDIIENEDSSFNDCVQWAFKGMILADDVTFPLKVG